MDIQTKQGEGDSTKLPSAQEGVDNGGGDAGATTDKLGKMFRDLLTLEEDEGRRRLELISKLGAARAQAAEEERRSRRAAWTQEARKVMLGRKLFRKRGMAVMFPGLDFEQILKKMDDHGPKEKARLGRLSPVWRERMSKDRTTFLFNEVIALLHPKSFLSRVELLHCRGVSREWRRSTDNWLQNFHHYAMQDYLQIRHLKQITWAEKLPVSFPVDVRRVGAFMVVSRQKFPPERNPFLSRTLALGSPSPGPLNRTDTMVFWREMGRLLDLWGEEVWTVQFQFSNPSYFDAAGAYKMISQLLSRMPNLRHLMMFSPVPINGEDNELRISMLVNPLPELPHLKSIEASHIPSPIIRLMLEKFGPTLDTVIAYWVDGRVCEQTPLPKLKVMSLMPYQVSSLTMNWPSLNVLDLRYDHAVAEDIPNIFRNLAVVGGTLRKLNLILENVKGSPTKLDAGAIERLSLDLPNLEELTLSMCLGQGNLKTIDFILPMSKLKILSLNYVRLVGPGGAVKKAKTKIEKSPGPDVGPQPGSSKQKERASGGWEEMIKYWKYINRLYESNVWLLFPELKRITIVTFEIERLERKHHQLGVDAIIDKDKMKENVFTREGFKQFANGKTNEHQGAN